MISRVRDQGLRVEDNTSSPALRLLLLATLLGVLFLGLALRLYRLDASSLWWDEVKTATTARLDFVGVWQFQATRSAHPPLLYVITGLFVRLGGESDFVVRLQAALFGALTVALTYELGVLLWTRSEGVMAALLLAINAFHLRYSQEARHYSLMVLLVLLSLACLLKALRENRKSMWLLFAVFTALSLYTHYFAFLILPSELIFAAWVIAANWRSRRGLGAHSELRAAALVNSDRSAGAHDSLSPGRQALHLAWALALVGLAYVPWLPSLKLHLFGRMVEFGGVGLGELPKADLSLHYFAQVLQAYTGFGGLLLLLWLALFALGLATNKPRYILLFGLWIAVPFAFPFLVRSSHFFDVKYAIYVLPILLLLTARGVSVLISFLTRRLPVTRPGERWQFALGSLLAVFVFGALSVEPLRAYYLSPKADYRGVAEYLAANAHPGDIILADGEGYPYGDSTTVIRNLTYYLDRLGITDIPVLSVEPGLVEAVAREVPPHAGEVWGVLLGKELAALGADDVAATTRFDRLMVVQLRSPSDNVAQNTVLVLHAITRLLGGTKAEFDIRLALAEFYAAAGNEGEAAAQFELAMSTQPADRSAHLSLAAFHAGQEEWEDAVEEYLAFFRAPPSLLEGWRERQAYWDLGFAYEQLGSFEQALAAYTKILDLDPTYWQAYRELGRLHLSLGQPDEALTAYQRAMALQPQNAHLYVLLGRAYLSLGRIDEALAAYESVEQLDPTHWEGFRELGDLYLGLGEPFEALAAYQSAVDLQPQNTYLYCLLGRAYQALDRTEEATLAYQQALALDPNNDRAKAQLATLSKLESEEIPHPLFSSLGGDINLLGYDFSPAMLEDGGALQVTLWWQALASMDRDYTVFVHVVGPDGHLWAQSDSLLTYGELPTSAWPAGSLVQNTYQLQLPMEAGPGQYTVLVGAYYWETGERLPVWDQEGVRAPGDTIALATFTLER